MKLGWLLFCALSGTCLSQTHLGSIDVTVTDPRGALVPSALVVAERTDTGASKEARTDSSGYCRVEGLLPGTYTVRVSAPGFKDAEVIEVKVNSAEEAKVPVQMTTGPASETIEVTADAPMILSLPAFSRNGISLMLLSAGVASTSAFGSTVLGVADTESADYFVRLASRSTDPELIRNSISLSDDYDNSSPAPLPPDLVGQSGLGSNFEARFGNGNGTQLNETTKSGTNSFHGGVAFGFSDKSLNARNYFDTQGPKPGDDHRFERGAVGFPIVADRLFVFAGASEAASKVGRVVLATVPTQSDVNSALRGLGANDEPPSQNAAINSGVRQLFSYCASVGQCPGGTTLWPSPTFADRRFFNAIANLHTSQDRLLEVGRLDYAPSDSLHIACDYSGEHDHGIGPTMLQRSDDLPSTNVKMVTESNLGAITLEKVFSSTILLVPKFAVTDIAMERTPADVFQGFPGGLPQIVVFGYSSVGLSPFDNGSNRAERAFIAQAELRIIRGSQNLAIGYEFRRLLGEYMEATNTRGRLLFRTLEDLFKGTPLIGSINSGASNRNLDRDYDAAYVQDNVRLNSTSTINLGLRWEYLGDPSSNQPLYVFSPVSGLEPRSSIYSPELTDFSPRLGYSGDFGGWILRVGASIFYSSLPLNSVAGQVQNNSFHPGLAFNSPTLVALPTAALLPPVPNSFFRLATQQGQPQDEWDSGPLNNTYSENYVTTLKFPTGKALNVLLGYAGAFARKLPRVVDENAPVTPALVRPYTDVTNGSTRISPFVINRLESSATSAFSSLQVLFGLSNYHGISGSAQWQWAHAIDDASDVLDLLPNQSLPDAGNAKSRERASSNFDIRHRFDFNFTYTTGTRIRYKPFSDVSVAISGNLFTGQPFNPILGEEADPFGLRDFAFRPDSLQTGRDVNQDPLRRIPLSIFTLPCTLVSPAASIAQCAPGSVHGGSLSRNFFSGPGTETLSLRFSKSFVKHQEKFRFTFAGDFLNILNTPSFPVVSSSALSDRVEFKTFGSNTGLGGACNSPDCFLSNSFANPGRRIQLSAGFIF